MQLNTSEMQHRAAKAFQVGECNFKAAHEDSTLAKCCTSQRRQLTAGEMQHKSVKAAQFQLGKSGKAFQVRERSF
jgi:hypothetical protein